MTFTLPRALEVGGREIPIDADFRTIITIFTAFVDPELSDPEKWYVALNLFYEGELDPDQYQEAAEKFIDFINAGEPEKTSGPRLMDWEQDFNHIIAPVNRIIGHDIRGDDFVHWWTFLSAYQEIGECLFSQIISIRDKQAHGKKLDKAEREWANRNARLIRLKPKYTQAELDLLEQWKGVMADG